MKFQLSSVFHDIQNVIQLFLTYEGITHHAAFSLDDLTSPEKTKEVLVGTITCLLEAYVASKMMKSFAGENK